MLAQKMFSLLFLFTFLWGCNLLQNPLDKKDSSVRFNDPKVVLSGENDPNSGTPSQSAMEVFESTVHPLLIKNCQSCHGAGQSPVFAVNNVQESYDTLVKAGKVNFESPDSSRLYLRLQIDHHNCWSGQSKCADDAQVMLSALQKWALAVNSKPADLNYAYKTESLKFENATQFDYIKIDESDFVVFEAEDSLVPYGTSEQWDFHRNKVLGRLEVDTDSGASDFRYALLGANPVVHPRGDSSRVTSINSACESVESDPDLLSKSPFKISEGIRYPDQDGYRMYSMRLNGYIILPEYRLNQYKPMVDSYNFTGRDVFILRDGAFDNQTANVLAGNIVFLTTNNEANTNGNHFRVLPDFSPSANIASYKDSADFFAPRFGVNSDEFYTATFRELYGDSPGQGKVTRKIKKEVLYWLVRQRFEEFFFEMDTDANGIKRPRLDANGIRVNKSLANIPSYFRNKTFEQVFCIPKVAATPSDPGGCGLTPEELTVENAVGTGNQFDNIDYFIYYYLEPGTKSPNSFSVKYLDSNRQLITRDTFNLHTPATDPLEELNLNSLFVGAVDPNRIAIEAFAETVHPVLTQSGRCVRCHTGAGNTPVAHSDSDAASAYQAIVNFPQADKLIIDRSNPANSRLVRKLVESGTTHTTANNCSGWAGGCAQAAQEIQEAIGRMVTLIDQKTSQGSDLHVSLSDRERLPARLSFKVQVSKTGSYNVWYKLKSSIATPRVRTIIYEGSRAKAVIPKIAGVPQNSSCSTNAFNFPQADLNRWVWQTISRNNEANRLSWDLQEGKTYTIEVVEIDSDTKIDQLAINYDDPEKIVATLEEKLEEPWKRYKFAPHIYNDQEFYKRDSKPRILRYDLSSYLNKPVFFEIELKNLKQDPASQSYVFRNPKFITNGNNVKVKDLRLHINNSYEFSNTTYNSIDLVVGDSQRVIVKAPLVALKVNGMANDQFAFSFKELSLTDQPESEVNNDFFDPSALPACKNQEKFVALVKPILFNFVLAEKGTGMNTIFTHARDFPGRDRMAARNPQFYNCITCHTENHPFFKMSTYDDETLCRQVRSRVNFNDPDLSLVFRGIKGLGNHPQLHFVQDVQRDTNSWQVNANLADANGPWYVTRWLGKMDVYTESDFTDLRTQYCVNGAGLTAQQRTDCQNYYSRLVGQYKRIQYPRYNSNPGDVQYHNAMKLAGDMLADGVNDLYPLQLRRWDDPAAVAGETVYPANYVYCDPMVRNNTAQGGNSSCPALESAYGGTNSRRNIWEVKYPTFTRDAQGRIVRSVVERFTAANTGDSIKVKDEMAYVNSNDPLRTDFSQETIEFEAAKQKYTDAITEWINSER